MMKSETEIQNILKREEINSLCRICLVESDGAAKSIFDISNSTSFSHKIMLCTAIEIRDSDGLPHLICDQCLSELDIADNFRMKCEYSDGLLKRICYNGVWQNDANNKNELGNPPFFSLSREQEIKEEVPDILPICGSSSSSSGPHPEQLLEKRERKNKKSVKSLKRKTERNMKETLDIEIKTEFSDNDSRDDSNILEHLTEESLKSDIYKSDIEGNIKDKMVYNCHLCNKPLKSKYTLEKHINNMHSPEKLVKLGNVTGYGAERRFHCTECDYKSRYKKTLLCHIRIHTGEKPYKCDQCESRFAQHASLGAHKRTHSDKTYYTCAECGKQFKHKKVYEAHKRVHTNEKNYICSICNKGLTTQHTLEDHMKRHYNIKNFSCESCGAIFVSRSELTNHSKVHNPDRRFLCNFCDFSTYTKRKLEIHIKRHTGERAFKCDLCQHSCYTPYDLKSHMRSHSKEKNYSCPECEQRFKHSSKVNRHMLKVHGKKYRWNDLVDRRCIK